MRRNDLQREIDELETEIAALENAPNTDIVEQIKLNNTMVLRNAKLEELTDIKAEIEALEDPDSWDNYMGKG